MKPFVDPADKVVLDGDINWRQLIIVRDGEFNGILTVPEGDRDYYDGPYEVIPTAYDQELDTDNKFMVEDVTVREIPYVEVSNPAGGTTVSIG